MTDRISPFYGIAFAVLASVLLLATSAMAQGYGTRNAPSSPSSSAAAIPPGSYRAPPVSGEANTAGATEPLAQIRHPAQRLAALSVEDNTGLVVGSVRGVRMSPNGTAASVKMELAPPARPGQTVTLQASDLSFDPGKNVLVSSLNASTIAARAGLPSYTPSDRASGGG